jgi:hypothetical protein
MLRIPAGVVRGIAECYLAARGSYVRPRTLVHPGIGAARKNHGAFVHGKFTLAAHGYARRNLVQAGAPRPSRTKRGVMRNIETSIDISAPASRVWEILADFEAYPNWNPFITKISGSLLEGARLEVRVRPPGQSAMTFKPTILALMPERDLIWLGHMLLPGLFDGKHLLRIEDLGETCRFHQTEEFSGALVPLFGKKLLDATRLGFNEMNLALKHEAEN